MIQLQPYDPIVYVWGISALLPLFYWLVFSSGSKFAGTGARFFDTAQRTIVVSEAVGIAGSIIRIIVAPESLWTVGLLAVWTTPLIILMAYLSQALRHSIESHQAVIPSSENTSHKNPDQ